MEGVLVPEVVKLLLYGVSKQYTASKRELSGVEWMGAFESRSSKARLYVAFPSSFISLIPAPPSVSPPLCAQLPACFCLPLVRCVLVGHHAVRDYFRSTFAA